jgi:hypothetical protein
MASTAEIPTQFTQEPTPEEIKYLKTSSQIKFTSPSYKRKVLRQRHHQSISNKIKANSCTTHPKCRATTMSCRRVTKMCRIQSQQKALKAPPLINTSTIAQATFFFSFDAFMYVCMYVCS